MKVTHTLLNRQTIVRAIAGALVSLSLAVATAAPAHAQSQSSTSMSNDASFLSAIYGSVLVAGPIMSVQSSAEFAVTSVQAAGDSVIIGLKQVGASAAQGSEASVRVSTQSAKALGVAVGSTVRSVSEATGWALYASAAGASVVADKLISFVPNEVGKLLLHVSGITYTK